jgi:hypothetical protein
MAPLLRATSGTPRRTSGNKDGNANTCMRGESIRTKWDGNSNTCIGGESIRSKWDGNVNTYIGGDSVRANKDGNVNTCMRGESIRTKKGWELEYTYKGTVYVQTRMGTWKQVSGESICTKLCVYIPAGSQ